MHLPCRLQSGNADDGSVECAAFAEDFGIGARKSVERNYYISEHFIVAVFPITDVQGEHIIDNGNINGDISGDSAG